MPSEICHATLTLDPEQDALLLRFDEAWQAETPPDPCQFCPANSTANFVKELILIDMQRRYPRNLGKNVETYWPLFSGQICGDHILNELVCEEIKLRRRYGIACERDDYLGRFPQFADRLAAWLAEETILNHTGTNQTQSLATGQSGSDEIALPAVAGYEVLGILGRGGMGLVYKARQVALQRLVALKMIIGGQHFSPEQEARFRAEAQVLARLQHPNIVQVHEIGTHQAQPYFSMEYIDGGSLGSTPQPAAEAARLVRTLARAVHAAHQSGIIHRDLKPANILLTADGTPKITDFGLAKRQEGGPGLTLSGAIVGTPSYMAPEQAAGKSKEIGPVADIYALGAILYEVLTGRPPFKGPTAMDTVLQVISTEPVAVRQLQPQVPRDLETICLKCLQKESSKRYSTADELAEDLQRFLANEPIKARPVGRLERAVRWCQRNPVVASLLALILLVTVVAAGVVVQQLDRALTAERAEKNRAEDLLKTTGKLEKSAEELHTALVRAVGAEQKEKKKAEDLQEALEREKKAKKTANDNWTLSEWRVYANNISLAQAAWEGNDINLANQYLESCRRDFRGWEFYYLLALLNCKNQMDFHGHIGSVNSVALSSDGMRIVSGSVDNTIKVWDVVSGNVTLTLQGHTLGVSQVSFNSDGTRIVSGSHDQTVKVWDARTGKETLTLKGHTGPVDCVAFSPDGKWILSGSWDMTVKVWHAANGQEALTLVGHKSNVSGVAVSADGKRIITSSGDTTVKVWDAASGKDIFTIKSNAGINSMAVSANDKWIATGHIDQTVKVWDGASGKEVSNFKGHTAEVLGVAFSPDGQRIVSSSGDQTVKIWEMASSQVLTLKGHTGEVRSVAFSPDGQWVVSGSGESTVKVWGATTSKDTLLMDLKPAHCIGFSADGRRFVSGNGNNSVTLWKLAGFEQTLVLPQQQHAVLCAAFSPDGQWIVGGTDNLVKVWDAISGREKCCLIGHTAKVQSVAFSADGKWIVSGGAGIDGMDDKPGEIKIWNAVTGQETRALKGHLSHVKSVAFSANGKWIVSGSWDKTVKVWDAASGQEAFSFQGHTQSVSCVSFSADDKWIASSGFDWTVKIWDAASGKEIRTLIGHKGLVNSVGFSPDGTRLVSSSGDKTVKIWDVASGRETLTLMGHKDSVRSVVFSADGQRIFSSSWTGTIKIWSIEQPFEIPQKIKAAPVDPTMVLDIDVAGLNINASLSPQTKSITYQIKMIEGATYRIDLKSRQFDAFLFLEDALGQKLAEDDDSGGDLNSRIVFRVPASAVYRIVASSFDMQGTGKFSLHIRAEGAPLEKKTAPADPAKLLDIGVAGLRIKASLNEQIKFITYQVKMTEGKTYRLDLKSKQFDAFLVLENANGLKLAEDDDSGGGLDSRIVFRAPASGTYRIVASSLGMVGTGDFHLEVREE